MARFSIRPRKDGSRMVQATLGDPRTGVLSFSGVAKDKADVPRVIKELAEKVAAARVGKTPA